MNTHELIPAHKDEQRSDHPRTRLVIAPHADDEVLGCGEPRGISFGVAVVGLGYVGRPTALAMNAVGLRVLGLDVSEAWLDVIRSQQADLLDSDRNRLSSALEDPSLIFSTDLSLLARAAAVVVCVPTPVDPYLVPDLGILRGASALWPNWPCRDSC